MDDIIVRELKLASSNRFELEGVLFMHCIYLRLLTYIYIWRMHFKLKIRVKAILEAFPYSPTENPRFLVTSAKVAVNWPDICHMYRGVYMYVYSVYIYI